VATTPTAHRSTSAHERLRTRIDSALDRYTDFGPGSPADLTEAIRYAVLAPGKRLRPRLVLLATEACGGSADAALPAACAVEMVHAYSLVHDDLPAMDDDDLRRGRPTCHKAFGEATAILVGDALLARAFEIIADDVQPPERAARCCAVLGRAAGATELVGGQAADLAGGLAGGFARDPAASDLDATDVDALESIHRRKTAAMITASVELGGIVAGATAMQLAALRLYGQNLGLAFQITDDLLDVSGDPSVVGKRLAKDAERGKITYPQVLGVAASRERARQLVDAACVAIESFGPPAAPLHELAQLVSHRES
jgi:geranylgeranyl diphosphate synthase type II